LLDGRRYCSLNLTSDIVILRQAVYEMTM
jgi:hypothetical protein